MKCITIDHNSQPLSSASRNARRVFGQVDALSEIEDNFLAATQGPEEPEFEFRIRLSPDEKFDPWAASKAYSSFDNMLGIRHGCSLQALRIPSRATSESADRIIGEATKKFESVSNQFTRQAKQDPETGEYVLTMRKKLNIEEPYSFIDEKTINFDRH